MMNEMIMASFPLYNTINMGIVRCTIIACVRQSYNYKEWNCEKKTKTKRYLKITPRLVCMCKLQSMQFRLFSKEFKKERKNNSQYTRGRMRWARKWKIERERKRERRRASYWNIYICYYMQYTQDEAVLN